MIVLGDLLEEVCIEAVVVLGNLVYKLVVFFLVELLNDFSSGEICKVAVLFLMKICCDSVLELLWVLWE